jgi:hypothetical protein
LDDRDLLPHSLKEQSLSDREIVLTPENASRAVDVLEAAQWATATFRGIYQQAKADLRTESKSLYTNGSTTDGQTPKGTKQCI